MDEWLRKHREVNISRRVTNYIDPFPLEYRELVTAEGYAPDQEKLIDDYLLHNPTRNRALDMLPMFCHLDNEKLRAIVDDPRVKPRPTLHYRIPDCRVDNYDWSLTVAWRDYLQLDELARDSKRLDEVCAAYQKSLTPSPENKIKWHEQLASFLIPELL